MEVKEIKELCDGINKSFEEFKKHHEKEIAEIKESGAASANTTQNLDRLSERMNEAEEKLQKANEEAKARDDAIKAREEELDKKLAAFNRAGGPGVKPGYSAKLNDYLLAVLLKQGDIDEARFDPSEYGSKAGLHQGEEIVIDRKLLSTDSDPDGGYVVSPDKSGRRVVVEFPTSPMRGIASVQSTNKPFLEGLYDGDEPEAATQGEREDAGETGTPEIGIWRVPIHDCVAHPRMTENMRDDSDIDMVGWLMDHVNRKLMRKQNTAFVTGTGSGEARGFMTYDDGTNRGQIERIQTATTLVIAADDLLDLEGNLKEEYKDGDAVYVMHRKTKTVVRKLKDSQGQYLWVPSVAVGMAPGTPPQFNGFGVIAMEDIAAPDSGTTNSYTVGKLPVAFGNFRRGYQVAERSSMTVLEDRFTAYPKIVFRTNYRYGGAVVNFEALKILEITS